ncbi:MAG: T9SS type B sorting domain-containing protein [Candidatus Kapabacteria bacterium]|nr:T9SS type B sorting domain-containing protein [Candidatus Kapabacteria bacterium]
MTVGNYFSGSGGTGTAYNAGDTITSTTTLYVYAETGTTPNCFAETIFTITIYDTPVPDDLDDVYACDSYVLEPLTVGNYFSGTGGTGTAYNAGDTITATTTLYVYAETGTTPNCFAETNFIITIYDTPVPDDLDDVYACDSYVLEPLTVGNYFSGTGGTGTAYNAGDTITSTTTLYVYAETGTTPNCFAETNFTITIYDTPVPDDLDDVYACDSYVLEPLTVGNYFSGTGGTGTAYNAGDTITSTTTLYIYAETDTTPNCFAETNFTVTIYYPPVAYAPSPIEICDDSNDGFGIFDLTQVTDVATGGVSGLSVSFHETQTDADLGVNAISPADSYLNIQQGSQPIYIRVFETSSPDCYSVSIVDLIVRPRPVLNTAIAAYELCDDNNPGDGFEVFDLTSLYDDITLNQSFLLTYYYEDGGVQIPITTPTAFTNTVAHQQTIYVEAENIYGCLWSTSFEIVVNPLPVVITPSDLISCSDGINVGIALFDLTLLNAEVTGGVSGMIVSYYSSQSDADLETNPLSLPYLGSDGEEVFIRVENGSTGCYDTTSVFLVVHEGPIAQTPDLLTYCDPNNDNIGLFDLTQVELFVTGGAVNSVVSYHETFTDADLGVNGIATPESYITLASLNGIQIIYIRVSSTVTACYSIVALELVVNPTPVIAEPTAVIPLEVCDEDTDGIGVFDLTLSIDNILNGLDPSQHTVTFHTDEITAVSGQNPIVNVLGYVNSVSHTDTVWVRVEINDTGCFRIVPLELIVNPLPVVSLPLPSYTLCDSNPLDEREFFSIRDYAESWVGVPSWELSFYASESDADLGINALSDVYQNTSNPQTIWIVVVNPATGCQSKTVMDLRVEPLPELLIPSGGISVCDSGGSGYGVFDLDNLIPTMLNGASGITVTFHETQTDADLGVNALLSPYDNLTAFFQTVYVRALDDLTGCYQVFELQLYANSTPVIPPLSDLTMCDQDGTPQSGTTLFDLTVYETTILSEQISGTYHISYHTDQVDAQQDLDAILTPDSFANTSNPQTIWLRVENTASGCYSVSSFSLEVELPADLPLSMGIISECDDNNDSYLTFDLTGFEFDITGGYSGYTFEYYPSLSDALAGTSQIEHPDSYTNSVVSVQTIGLVVITPSGCRSITTFDIRVLPIPVVNAPSVLELCDESGTGAGESLFDLTTFEQYISGGDPNLTIVYYEAQSDAHAGINEILNPDAYLSGGGIVWVKVMNLHTDSSGNNCYVLLEQQLVVHLLPEVVQSSDIPDYIDCVLSVGAPGEFILSSWNSNIVSDASELLITHHTSQSDAELGVNPLPDFYITTNPFEPVWVRVSDSATGCYDLTSFNLVIEVGAEAHPVAPDTPGLRVCDQDGINDGHTGFDLTFFGGLVLDDQIGANYAVSYYESYEDAMNNTGGITTPSSYVNTNNPQQIWIVVVDTDTVSQCREFTVITLEVDLLPEPLLTDGYLCYDYTTGDLLNTHTFEAAIDDSILYTYQWTHDGAFIAGATDSTYTADQPGVYSVIATDIQTGCENETFANLGVTSSAVITGVSITGAFSDNQVLEVIVSGYGQYEFSLNYGPWQTSPVFYNVSPGEQYIRVRDLNNGGCEDSEAYETAINYPHFFTPNGDGYNDTWNIIGLSNQPTAKIYIFDRYGKFIKQISPAGQGWDGTYSGQPLPSTDYWFTVTYEEDGKIKEFKAHFSLKR